MMPQPQHNTLDQTTLDNLMEGCQLISFDWQYLYVNNAVIKQSKYSKKSDLLGYTMMEKYPGIETTALFALLKKCMKERTSGTMLNEFTFPNNSKGWFELRIEPVPKGLFILSMDISERKRAEQAKKDYIHSLEETIFMISHKIRQPVCNIFGLLSIIDNSNTTKKDIKTIGGYLTEAIKALDTFTRELTTFIHEKKIKINTEYNKKS